MTHNRNKDATITIKMMVYTYVFSHDPIKFDVHELGRSELSTHVESDEHQKQSGFTEFEQPLHVANDLHVVLLGISAR